MTFSREFTTLTETQQEKVETLARDIFVKVEFIISCARLESMIPTTGNNRIPFHICVTGVDISKRDLL